MEAIKNLPLALSNPLAVFSYGNKAKAQNVIVRLLHEGKEFLVGVFFNQRHRGIVVSDIRGLFPKDTADWLHWIEQGKLLYADKKGVLNLIDQRRINLAEVDYLDLEHVAKVVESFENPKLPTEGEVRMRQGSSERVVNAELERAVAKEVAKLEEKLGTKVIVHDSTESITHPTVRRRISEGANVKGWYDTTTGEVHIYLPNVESVEDVRETYLHEVVGHKGLRGLLDSSYDAYLDKLWSRLTDRDKRWIMEREYGWRGEDMPSWESLSAQERRRLMDEWLAYTAETGSFELRSIGLWQKVVDWLTEVLAELGITFRSPYYEIDSLLRRTALHLNKQAKAMASTNAKQKQAGGAVRFRMGSDIGAVNDRFNAELAELTEENANSVRLQLGMPSDVLLSAGVLNKPMLLYGNKLMKKVRKHGYDKELLKNLPLAVADPIAVFNNYLRGDNRSILTEIKAKSGNVLVSVTVGKDGVLDINVVSSVFPKLYRSVLQWLNKGYATYINKKKALNYLASSSAPIADATPNNSELLSATKVVNNFENPTLEDGEVRYRMGEKPRLRKGEGLGSFAGRALAWHEQRGYWVNPTPKPSKPKYKGEPLTEWAKVMDNYHQHPDVLFRSYPSVKPLTPPSFTSNSTPFAMAKEVGAYQKRQRKVLDNLTKEMKKVSRWKVRLIDRAAPLEQFLNAMRAEGFDVASHEDAYSHILRSSGMAQSDLQQAHSRWVAPLHQELKSHVELLKTSGLLHDMALTFTDKETGQPQEAPSPLDHLPS